MAPQGGKGQTAKMWLRRGQIHAGKGLEAPSVEEVRGELL